MRFLLLSLLFVFLSQPVWAHGDHEDHFAGGNENQSVSNQGEASDQEVMKVRELAHLIHESITGEHSHHHGWKEFFKSFVKKETWVAWWRGIQNMPNAPTNYQRALNEYSVRKGQAGTLKEDATNVAIAYGIGEAVEIVVIPALGSHFLMTSEAHWLIKGIVGFLSWSTPLPGIEPACIAIVGCYLGIKPIRHLGIAAHRGVSKYVFAPIRGLDQWFRSEVSAKDILEDAIAQINSGQEFELRSYWDDSLYKFSLVDSADNLLLEWQLDWESYDNPIGWKIEGELKSFYISKLLLDHDDGKQIIKHLGSMFGGNFKQAVVEAFKKLKKGNLEDLDYKMYVDYIEEHGEHYRIFYKPHYIFVGPQRKMNPSRHIEKLVGKCNKVLGG